MKDFDDLVAKLREQFAPEAAANKPKLVTHHEWDLTVERMNAVQEAFRSAADGLLEAAEKVVDGKSLPVVDSATDPSRATVLAEVAYDLALESADLSRRAAVRRRLAPRDPKPADKSQSREKPVPKPPKHQGEPPVEPDVPVKGRQERHVDGPHGIRKVLKGLGAAQDGLTTATSKAMSGSGDEAASAFLEELDILAEMTLRLRRRVDEISVRDE